MSEEADFKRELLKQLEAIPGIIVMRQQAGSLKGGRIHLGPPGIPDFQILLPRGRTMFIELKSASGKLSPSQEEMHACLTVMGHRVATLHATHGCVQRVLDVVMMERAKALTGAA